MGHVASAPKEQNLTTLFNDGENSQVCFPGVQGETPGPQSTSLFKALSQLEFTGKKSAQSWKSLSEHLCALTALSVYLRLLCLFSSLSVDHGGKLWVSCLLYDNFSFFILNQRVLKMILFGIFCGHLKIYICWSAPTCPYLEEAGIQQSAYVSGEPKPCSFGSSIPSAFTYLIGLTSLLPKPGELAP